MLFYKNSLKKVINSHIVNHERTFLEVPLNFILSFAIMVVSYSFPRLDLDHKINEQGSKKLYFLTDNISKKDKDKLETFAKEYKYNTMTQKDNFDELAKKYFPEKYQKADYLKNSDCNH